MYLYLWSRRQQKYALTATHTIKKILPKLGGFEVLWISATFIDFSVMVVLICIKKTRGTIFIFVNIANRFQRIFSDLET